MKICCLFLCLFLIAGCTSKKPTQSTDAEKELVEKWTPEIGRAKKADFIERFGNAEWCRQSETGAESCRFYRKKGTVWIGESKTDKKSYMAFDEVIVDFDANGVLTKFKSSAQR